MTSVKFVLLALWALSDGLAYAGDELIQLTQEQQRNLGIRTLKPTITKTTPIFQAPASVVIPPTGEYWVSSVQAGRVSRIWVAQGDSVTKGQALIDIQSPKLLSIQRDYLRALNDFKLAQARWQQSRSLLKEGIISKRRWQESHNEYQAHQATVDETQQLLFFSGLTETDIARLARNHQLLNSVTIRAPASGVIVERLVNLGQSLEPQAALFRLADLNYLWLIISWPQERWQQISLGDEVTIDGTASIARVTLIGHTVDPVRQSIGVRAEIDPATNTLRPGQKLMVSLLHKSKQALVQVPAAAIMRHDKQAYVFIQQDQGFQLHPVIIVGQRGQQIILNATAIPADKNIVYEGVAVLKASWMGIGGDQ